MPRGCTFARHFWEPASEPWIRQRGDRHWTYCPSLAFAASIVVKNQSIENAARVVSDSQSACLRDAVSLGYALLNISLRILDRLFLRKFGKARTSVSCLSCSPSCIKAQKFRVTQTFAGRSNIWCQDSQGSGTFLLWNSQLAVMRVQSGDECRQAGGHRLFSRNRGRRTSLIK